MKHLPSSQEIEASLRKGLREKGYKLTSPRLAIISLLSKDMTHPDAMDLLHKIKKKLPHVSMSTVYYTLDILKKEGLICEIEFYDRNNRYDVNVKDHINLICRKCGKIEDFHGKIPFSYARITEQTNFQPVGMRYEYYGYCKTCKGSLKK